MAITLHDDSGWGFGGLATTPTGGNTENAADGSPYHGTNTTAENADSYSANGATSPGNPNLQFGSNDAQPQGNNVLGGTGGGQVDGGNASGPLLISSDFTADALISDPWSPGTAASVYGSGAGSQSTMAGNGLIGGHNVPDGAVAFVSADRSPRIHQPFLPLAAHGSGGGGSSSGSGSGEIATETFTSPNSNLKLVVNFDASTAKAPAGFDQDIATVAQDMVNQFSATTAITVTLDVGYGEVAGSRLSAGVLGESDTYYQTVPGSTASAQYANLASAFSTGSYPLPGTDPVSGNQQWWVTTAEGKALGLFPNSSSVDGYVGFSSASGIFDYNMDPTTGITVPSSGEYDFAGTVAHEISEVMGRATLNGEKYPGYKLPEYMPLDLFHYSANGVRDFSGTMAGYFSVDGGATDLKNFNTNPQGDFSDWQSVAGSSDAFDAFGGLGMASPVSQADYTAMQAAGWIGTGYTGPWG